MCKICDIPSLPFATGRILRKYEVQYFRCPECGLVQTEEPYWLDEAYAQAIGAADVGLLSRNVNMARTTEVVITAFFNPDKRFVDYGGGYGAFVRLMRDAGFDFHLYDKHCANLFAQGHEVAPDNRDKFELLTAFEVFEHLAEPTKELDQMLEKSSNIFLSTSLIPLRDPPKPGHWWYYSMDGGQHITLYTRESISRLAARAGLRAYSRGNTHLLTKKRLPDALFRLLCGGRVSRLGELLLPNRRSLLDSDAERFGTNNWRG